MGVIGYYCLMTDTNQIHKMLIFHSNEAKQSPLTIDLKFHPVLSHP